MGFPVTSELFADIVLAASRLALQIDTDYRSGFPLKLTREAWTLFVDLCVLLNMNVTGGESGGGPIGPTPVTLADLQGGPY